MFAMKYPHCVNYDPRVNICQAPDVIWFCIKLKNYRENLKNPVRNHKDLAWNIVLYTSSKKFSNIALGAKLARRGGVVYVDKS